MMTTKKDERLDFKKSQTQHVECEHSEFLMPVKGPRTATRI